MLDILAFLFSVTFLASLLNIVFPFRPFGKRSQAAMVMVVSLVIPIAQLPAGIAPEGAPNAASSKKSAEPKADIAEGKPDISGSLTVKTEKGRRGLNLVVANSSDTTFQGCRISLNGGEYSLRRPTVIDANSHRAYPLYLFGGVGRVKDVLIHCFHPKGVAAFGR